MSNLVVNKIFYKDLLDFNNYKKLYCKNKDLDKFNNYIHNIINKIDFDDKFPSIKFYYFDKNNCQKIKEKGYFEARLTIDNAPINLYQVLKHFDDINYTIICADCNKCLLVNFN